MDLTQTQLLAVGGVLAILLGLIAYNRSAAAKGRAAKDADGPAVHPYICKFVQHEGAVVGEVVAMEGDRLILKQAGVFKSVPSAQAKPVGEELVLEGSVDWPAAIRDGTAWHQKNRSGASAELSGPLTRSEDVKAPALEALKDRKDGD